MNLGQLITNYRNEHDMSQRTFSARCGLSNSYISMLEKNCNPKTGEPIIPNISSLSKISAAMGISLDELLSSCDDIPISLDPTDDPHLDVTPDEQLLLDLFRQIPEADQALVLQMIRVALQSKGLL